VLRARCARRTRFGADALPAAILDVVVGVFEERRTRTEGYCDVNAAKRAPDT
jgi:hypothetical protein